VKPVTYALAALLLTALQAALLHQLGGGAVTICLAAPLLAHLALGAGSVEGAVGAAAIGYVLDVTAGAPKGLLTALSVAVFLGARLVGAAVHVRGRLGFAVLSAAATLGLSAGGVAMLRAVALPEAQPTWGLWPRLLEEALLTGLVAPLLLSLLRRLDGLLGAEAPDLIS
jgi:hypothetical protein